MKYIVIGSKLVFYQTLKTFFICYDMRKSLLYACNTCFHLTEGWQAMSKCILFVRCKKKMRKFPLRFLDPTFPVQPNHVICEKFGIQHAIHAMKYISNIEYPSICLSVIKSAQHMRHWILFSINMKKCIVSYIWPTNMHNVISSCMHRKVKWSKSHPKQKLFSSYPFVICRN